MGPPGRETDDSTGALTVRFGLIARRWVCTPASPSIAARPENLPPQSLPRILVIEDEPDLAALLVDQLGAIPATVHAEHDGVAGLDRAMRDAWALIILDLRLPGMHGIEVLKQILAATPDQSVLVLTARASELDRVLGLEIGADDYLTKPFSVLELLARCRALLRRHARNLANSRSVPAAGERAGLGALTLDRNQRRAWLADAELTLTPREFDLLWIFVSNPGKVFDRSALLDLVWGKAHEGYEHTVNTHMNRLRAKLGDQRQAARYIETVWGIGYRSVIQTECLNQGKANPSRSRCTGAWTSD